VIERFFDIPEHDFDVNLKEDEQSFFTIGTKKYKNRMAAFPSIGYQLHIKITLRIVYFTILNTFPLSFI
jgi:ribosomal protein S17E